MNILFNFRVILSATLHENIDANKIIKSIKKISKSNNNIFIVEEFHDISDVINNCIYFTIQNNILKINFSHIFYDGYSIFFILHKIDQIYKDEIDNYIFNIYYPNYSKFKVVINSIKLLPKINIKNVYNSLIKNKITKNKITKNKIIKTKIKILKTNLNELSTREVIDYLLDKHVLKEYCLIINARKLYNEYENVLGNLVFFSDNLNKDSNIRKSLQKKKKVSLEEKLNSTVPNRMLVNSYLNFILPSFLKYLKPPVAFGNYMIIHPVNNNEKYILVDYYY